MIKFIKILFSIWALMGFTIFIMFWPAFFFPNPDGILYSVAWILFAFFTIMGFTIINVGKSDEN